MEKDHMIIRLTHANSAPEENAVVPEAAVAKAPSSSRRARRTYALLFALACLAAIFYGCIVAYQKITQALTSTITTTAAPEGTKKSTDPEDMVVRVGKLMLLPQETPTIAVVSDLSKLQNQKFFANAHQGDIVLMYARAARAILYSPTSNKIIEVAPITNTTP